MFNIVCVGQRGRLEHEAALLAATLRHASPGFGGRLVVMEPQPGGRWPGDPRIGAPVRDLLAHLGAEILPFPAAIYGEPYPQGNKMEALAHAPPGPFLFLDTDTVVTGELADLVLDFDRPSASMRRSATWPAIDLYGPGHEEIWGSLYAARGLDFASSQDPAWPVEHWRRYLYFNAGWTFGSDAPSFGRRWLDAARMVEDLHARATDGRAADGPPGPLSGQTIWPWLDQIALPLVVHETGGGRPGGRGGIAEGWLDGTHSHHWRVMPLLYATAPDRVIETVEAASAPNRIKKVLKDHEPFKRFLYQGRGWKARALFDRDDLPADEQPIRNRLRREKLWMR